MINNIYIKILLFPVTVVFLTIIYVYRYSFSYFIGTKCRHIPTCSQYGVDCIKTHGSIVGGWLTIIRILKCNPWGTQGYDPVPEKALAKAKIKESLNDK